MVVDPRAWRDLVIAPRRDLGVEFANTVAWRGSKPIESLQRFDDLIDWLAANQALPPRAAAELRKWSEAHAAGAVAVFCEAIELRETLYRLLRSVALAADPADEDLLRLSAALSEAAPRNNLGRVGGIFVWRIEAKPTATGLLAPVLWSAADTLVGGDSTRLRECANSQCLWLFLDDSKNHTRRWCSMQACGNRAKAHRHYLRQKAK
jgi:predicted RNA-binding Zn ribbon-like protein